MTGLAPVAGLGPHRHRHQHHHQLLMVSRGFGGRVFCRECEIGAKRTNNTNQQTLPSFIHRRIHLHRYNCIYILFVCGPCAYGPCPCCRTGPAPVLEFLDRHLHTGLAPVDRHLHTALPLVAFVICIRALPLLSFTWLSRRTCHRMLVSCCCCCCCRVSL